MVSSIPQTSAFSPTDVNKIFGSQFRFLSPKSAHLQQSFKKIPLFMIKAKNATFQHDPKRDNSTSLRSAVKATQNQAMELVKEKQKSIHMIDDELDVFSEMKDRFLSFKKNKYLENLEHFEGLAKCQNPKFMVVACADSRVCPSSILGFQPGDAFVIRNVANLVPPYQNGPTETNAALEFAVNTLEVENILVVGHSCCGGIRALMSMEDDRSSSGFIANWVRNGKHAKLRTKASTSDLNLDQQCRHCEKVSVNHSLMNLLSYPWIEERVAKKKLTIHGGYYDFVDCTFEKWTLDVKGGDSKADGEFSIRNREFWC